MLWYGTVHYQWQVERFLVYKSILVYYAVLDDYPPFLMGPPPQSHFSLNPVKMTQMMWNEANKAGAERGKYVGELLHPIY